MIRPHPIDTRTYTLFPDTTLFRSMRIWLDSERLTNLGLIPADVVDAIGAQNVLAPVGRIGAQPMPDDQQLEIVLQAKGRLTDVEEFRNIVLRANPDGSLLRVGDVARVELAADRKSTRLNSSH